MKMPVHSYRAALGVAMILTSAWAATPARASLLYSNMAPSTPLFRTDGGYSLYGSGFGAFSNNTHAASFTPGVTEKFYFANFALRLVNPFLDYGTISLCQDDGGVPGAVIESVVTGPITPMTFVSPDAYTSIFSTLQPTLEAGTTYWFRVDMPQSTSARWLPNNILDLTTNPGSGFAWKVSGTSQWSYPSLFPESQWERPAFMVYGSPVPVPEPTSLSLLAIAIGALRRPRRTVYSIPGAS